MSKPPLFSIVIPTLHEEKYLPFLLSDLVEQTFKDFVVIHVDGNSEDKTVSAATKFTNRLTLKSYVVKKRNVAYQRNFGAKKARSPWLIFMDADNRLEPDFLAKIAEQLKQNLTVDIFTCLMFVEGELLKKSALQAINYGLELYYLLGKTSAFGALIGCRAKIFAHLKFDEKQKIYEDTIFAQAVVDAGGVFQLFKQPRYSYSLRRVEKEGMLKTLPIAIKMNLHHLQGKDFAQSDLGYVMKGGSYYDKIPKFSFKVWQKNLEHASEKQLLKAKLLLKKLWELEV
jgi:hypothetical protein